jgi:hypothetical protein
VRKTIRIFFANCPHLDESAAAYLVLAQNSVQSVVEFEIWHLHVYGEEIGAGNLRTSFLKTWSLVSLSGMALPWKQAAARRYIAAMDRLVMPPLASSMAPSTATIDLFRPILKGNEDWITGQEAGVYGNRTIRPAPTVIVTETPFEGGYFGWSESDVAIASIAGWRSRYTPPSLLEFILDQVQRYAMRLAINPELGSHYPTRACIWDFDANIADARLSPLIGYLCDSCEQLIAGQVTAIELKELRHLLSHKWLGKADEPGSVASTLKRTFAYDLTRTRGLSAGFLDRVREATPSEVVKLIGAAIALVASVAFGWWIKKHGL